MNDLTKKLKDIENASGNLEVLLKTRAIANRQTRTLDKDLSNILRNFTRNDKRQKELKHNGITLKLVNPRPISNIQSKNDTEKALLASIVLFDKIILNLHEADEINEEYVDDLNKISDSLNNIQSDRTSNKRVDLAMAMNKLSDTVSNMNKGTKHYVRFKTTTTSGVGRNEHISNVLFQQRMDKLADGLGKYIDGKLLNALNYKMLPVLGGVLKLSKSLKGLGALAAGLEVYNSYYGDYKGKTKLPHQVTGNYDTTTLAIQAHSFQRYNQIKQHKLIQDSVKTLGKNHNYILNVLNETSFAKTAKGKNALKTLQKTLEKGNVKASATIIDNFLSKVSFTEKYHIKKILSNKEGLLKQIELRNKYDKFKNRIDKIKNTIDEKSSGYKEGHQSRINKIGGINKKYEENISKELVRDTNYKEYNLWKDDLKFKDKVKHTVSNSVNFGKFKFLRAATRKIPIVSGGFLAADIINYIKTDCQEVIDNFEENPEQYDTKHLDVLSKGTPLYTTILSNMKKVKNWWLSELVKNSAELVVGSAGLVFPPALLVTIGLEFAYSKFRDWSLGFDFYDANFEDVFSFVPKKQLIELIGMKKALQIRGDKLLDTELKGTDNTINRINETSDNVPSITFKLSDIDITTKEGKKSENIAEKALVLYLTSFMSGMSFTTIRDNLSNYNSILSSWTYDKTKGKYDQIGNIMQCKDAFINDFNTTNDDYDKIYDFIQDHYMYDPTGIDSSWLVNPKDLSIPRKVVNEMVNNHSTFKALCSCIIVFWSVAQIYNIKSDYRKILDDKEISYPGYWLRYYLRNSLNIKGIETGIGADIVPMIKNNGYKLDSNVAKTNLRQYAISLLLTKLYITKQKVDDQLSRIDTIISYLKYAFKTFDNLGNYTKIENKINENSDALYEKYFEKDNKTKFSLSDINLSESDYSNVNNNDIDVSVVSEDYSTVDNLRNDIITNFVESRGFNDVTNDVMSQLFQNKDEDDYLSTDGDPKGYKADILRYALYENGISKAQADVLVPTLLRTRYNGKLVTSSFDDKKEFEQFVVDMLSDFFKNAGTDVLQYKDRNQFEQKIKDVLSKNKEFNYDQSIEVSKVTSGEVPTYTDYQQYSQNWAKTHEISNERYNNFRNDPEVSKVIENRKDDYGDIYKSLRQQGLSHAGAVGVLANVMSESSGNPFAFNPNDLGKSSYGIVQWRGERQDAVKSYILSKDPSLKDFIKLDKNAIKNMPKEDIKKARKSLLRYQTEYLVKELYDKSVVSNQKELVNALKGDNPAIATEYFTKYFERPANADAEAEKRKTNIDKFQNDSIIEKTEVENSPSEQLGNTANEIVKANVDEKEETPSNVNLVVNNKEKPNFQMEFDFASLFEIKFDELEDQRYYS